MKNIQIDPTRVRQGISEDLDMLNQESGLSGNDAVRWKTFSPAPKYDSANHCVEYGVELTIGQDSALNRYKMCLVRNGAVVLTLVGTPADNLKPARLARHPERQPALRTLRPAQRPARRRYTHQPALDEPLYLTFGLHEKSRKMFPAFYGYALWRSTFNF